MRKRQIQLLKDLITIPSPSGFEDSMVTYITKEVSKYIPKRNIAIDKQKNLVVKIEGKYKKSIMTESHTDEIGFVIRNVDRSGFISLAYIGGGDTQLLTARHLNILTSKGIVNAVVNRKHAHLVNDEDDEKIDNIYDAQVDIGIRGRKHVLRKVSIGDPVVYQPYFRLLANDKNQGQYVCGYGFDDKCCCFMLLELIKEIAKLNRKPEYTLYFVFSSREEIGNPPIKTVRELKPELYIGADVTFATDYGDDNLEKEVGKCELGKGITLYKGTNMDSGTINLLTKISRQHKIKIQFQASTGREGYNADNVLHWCDRAVIVAPPLRCMHSPVETINLKDLQYGINLLKRFYFSRDISKHL